MRAVVGGGERAAEREDHKRCERAPGWFMNYAELGSDKMRLVAIASFGIAVLGLYIIFNSTSAQISLAACTMYIVGTVLGVVLLQTES